MNARREQGGAVMHGRADAGTEVSVVGRVPASARRRVFLMAALSAAILIAIGRLSVWANDAAEPSGPPPGSPVTAYVVPVRDQIAKPILYILRRALKEAIEQEAEVVILDMDTPGGALNVTLELLEMLARFEGKTITYVNSEAISAGAFIAAATEDIYFSPYGVIGAAAPVLGSGEDLQETMRQKVISYLRARVRAVTEDRGYRAQVVTAMIDADYRLEIDGHVIKEPGELLSLTASEAVRMYGDPPQPLLGAGIADSIEGVLLQAFGDREFRIHRFEVTWSESLAQYLTNVSPILLGLGMLALFIEFKTPGFGIFGLSGLIMLAAVFLGHYVAGLSGHEPMLLFLLGAALVFLEVFVLPGLVLPALIGVVLMLGSLVWAMADIWPDEPLALSAEVFLTPMLNLAIGLAFAAAFAALLARFLPKSVFWDRLILQAAVGHAGAPVPSSMGPGSATPAGPPSIFVPLQRRGVAITDLYPSGEVEVDGKRYQARVSFGSAEAGSEVVVVGKGSFGLLVEPVDS